MGVCKHIKWKFYTFYRCFSWRKKVSQKLRKQNKMLKMKKESLWKLIVKNILWTDSEKNGVIFFWKKKKKSQIKSCTEVYAETENVQVFIDYFRRKITELTEVAIILPFPSSLNFPFTFILVLSKYSYFGYLLWSKHFLSFQNVLETSSEEVFGFYLTFQKWFVNFPNENNRKTNVKCRPPTIIGQQAKLFALDQLMQLYTAFYRMAEKNTHFQPVPGDIHKKELH